MERENIESIYSNYVFTTVSLSDVAHRVLYIYFYIYAIFVVQSDSLSPLWMCYPAQQGVISINVLSHF